jgi:transcription elongation factor Elf1
MATGEVTCKSCGHEIRFRRSPRVGQRFTCPRCSTQLEVIGLVPLEVDWAFDEPIGEPTSEIVLEDLPADNDRAALP